MSPPRPQNLLFILSDQHSRRALGCYGHPLVRTPHLDALAARGTLFSNAYCNSPICVPARASLHTGAYAFETGYWDNGRPYEGAVPSWGHWLQRRGHRVESIGKLHFRSAEDPTGFDAQTIPMHVVGGTGDLMGALRDGTAEHRKFLGYMEAAGAGHSTYTHYDADITSRTVEWLHARVSAAADDKPWVLFTSLVCPHPPLLAPPEHYAHYAVDEVPWPRCHDTGARPEHPAVQDIRRFLCLPDPVPAEMVRRTVAAYLGLCTYLDSNVGQIIAALDETGLADSTRVIYTSDHGEANGDRGIWGKCNMYEETLGVPLIVAGEGVPSGARCDAPVSHVDCFPTVLAGAGIEPSGPADGARGVSLLDVAKGEAGERSAFAEFHAASSCTAMYAVRQGRWKYVHYVDYPDQLFDLEADPDECDDLAGKARYLPVRRRLYAVLRALLDAVEVDTRARADQRRRVALAGGAEAVRNKGTFGYTPAPGEAAVFV